METETKRETGRRWTVRLPDMLAYLYQPVLPRLRSVEVQRAGPRERNPADILLPRGYVAEIVATNLNAPVHACFDDKGFCYVTESGHKVDAPPRIMKINVNTGEKQVFHLISDDRWIPTGSVTGACWHQGYLYFCNTNTLSRIGPHGQVEDLVTGLPGLGDHQTNHPVVGPDGKIYFGQGTVTNAGIVGADDYAFEWLPKYPQEHDVPAEDITLTGVNYTYPDMLGDMRNTVETGAFVPFGTATHPGQVIPGNVKASGAILRCNPDGSRLEVVAWGLRNPYGIAFDTEGMLFCTEHGMDERGKRFIVDDPDDFYAIREGTWYGWPDFSSGIRIDDPVWGKGGMGRKMLLQRHPNENPPKPFCSFPTHVAANGVDFCRNHSFGFYGDAFVALWGDLAPITTIRSAATPAGFKVVRVDMKTGAVHNFAVNKIEGPASKLPHNGFERPSHVAFGPDGALYVTDWGEVELAPEKGGIRTKLGTGTLWRIRRTTEPQGLEPPKAVRLPTRGIQFFATLLGVFAVAVAAVWGFRRLQERREARAEYERSFAGRLRQAVEPVTGRLPFGRKPRTLRQRMQLAAAGMAGRRATRGPRQAVARMQQTGVRLTERLPMVGRRRRRSFLWSIPGAAMLAGWVSVLRDMMSNVQLPAQHEPELSERVREMLPGRSERGITERVAQMTRRRKPLYGRITARVNRVGHALNPMNWRRRRTHQVMGIDVPESGLLHTLDRIGYAMNPMHWVGIHTVPKSRLQRFRESQWVQSPGEAAREAIHDLGESEVVQAVPRMVREQRKLTEAQRRAIERQAEKAEQGYVQIERHTQASMAAQPKSANRMLLPLGLQAAGLLMQEMRRRRNK